MTDHQSPHVTFHDAYTFEMGSGDERITGVVFKALPRRIRWEARVDGTSIVVHHETRGEAVAEAWRARRSEPS